MSLLRFDLVIVLPKKLKTALWSSDWQEVPEMIGSFQRYYQR
jgi:hypothetical protein